MPSPNTTSGASTPRAGEGASGGFPLGLVAALALFGWHVAHSNFLIDDAFISFRYAANWAEGQGLAFNPGEAPIEGYSNFLWVAFLGVARRAGLELESAARVLSILCATLSLLLVHGTLRRGGASRSATALGPLLLAAFPPFATWATGGLETALFTLLLLVAFDALLAQPDVPAASLRLAVTGLLLPLVRTDGLAFVGVLVVATWLAADSSGRRRLRPFVTSALLSAGIFLAWRRAHYGLWVANTVRVKAELGPDTLVRGLKTSATYLLLFVSPLATPLALGLGRGTALRRIGLAAALGFGAFLAYNTLVGGDWMPMFRMLAPASPFLALTLAVLLDRAVDRFGARTAWALGLPAVVLALLPSFDVHVAPRGLRESLAFRGFQTGYQTERARWQRGVDNLVTFRRIGRGLAQVTGAARARGETPTFTAGAIGAIGYHSGLTILDRNGLVEASVATRDARAEGRSAGHDKRVPRAFFLDRAPTYFEATLATDLPRDPSPAALRQAKRHIGTFVFRDPEEAPLRDHCVPEVHPLQPGPGLPEGSSLILLRRTDNADEARAAWSALGL